MKTELTGKHVLAMHVTPSRHHGVNLLLAFKAIAPSCLRSTTPVAARFQRPQASQEYLGGMSGVRGRRIT